MDNDYIESHDREVLTVTQWLITLIVFMIPCVGIIMMFVWAFGKGNENRKNLARAYLLYVAIGIVLGFLGMLFFGVSLSSLF